MAYSRSETSASESKNLPNKLLSCLYSQRKTGKFCDIVLNVGGVKFSVHSCVLASFSSYFSDLILSPSPDMQQFTSYTEKNKNCHLSASSEKDVLEHWSLRNPLQLTLPLTESVHERNMSCSDCTSKVLDFMYLGKIQIQKEHVEHVKLLSSILKVTELLLICEKFTLTQKTNEKRKSDFDSTEFVNKKQKGSAKSDALFVSEHLGKSETEVVKPIMNIKCMVNNNNKVEFQNKSMLNSEKQNLFTCDKVEHLRSTSEVSSFEYDKECAKVLKNSNIEHEKEPDEFVCLICKLKFPSMILLRQHRDTHRGRLYTCYACIFSSHKAFDLIKHLLEADHQEAVCSLCFFEAETSGKLKEHLKMHNHPKPFFCSICNVRFINRTALNIHTPKHSTEMPYSCTVCNRAFKWKQGLQSHMIVHTPEKKHLCPECGFSTAHKSTFRAHVLVHTSNMLICQHAGCSFKTVRKHNLASHLKTHSKEKPYQCEVCGQSYSQAKNLRRHAVKHDAVAVIEHCPLCLYQTMRVDKLKVHFKKHHPEGDETLLNLLRRKRHMLNVSKSKSEAPDPETGTKSPIEESNEQNVLPQSSFVLPKSDGNATLIPTPEVCTGKEKSADPVVKSEEMVILLDTANSNAVLMPTSQLIIMQPVENVKTENISLPEMGSLPFRTEQDQPLMSSDNLLSTCIDPKQLHSSTNGDYLLKNGKDSRKLDCLSLDSLSMNTGFEDSFTQDELPQSILDENSMFVNKETTSLDLINNNVIQELFPENSALGDAISMFDILSKEVPGLVVLDTSKEMLLCHETISDDADNVQSRTLNKDNGQMLQSFKSFESILESL